MKALRFNGFVLNRRPEIPVLVEIPFYKVSGIVRFVVDTGSSYSAITEKDAQLIKLDCTFLPYQKVDAVGFGGKFKNKTINRLVLLIFKSDDEEHQIKRTDFRVNCIPPNLSTEDRETLIRYTPSVLGMDVISEFKFHMENSRFYLEC